MPLPDHKSVGNRNIPPSLRQPLLGLSLSRLRYGVSHSHLDPLFGGNIESGKVNPTALPDSYQSEVWVIDEWHWLLGAVGCSVCFSLYVWRGL